MRSAKAPGALTALVRADIVVVQMTGSGESSIEYVPGVA
jgi:hypothetical protein